MVMKCNQPLKLRLFRPFRWGIPCRRRKKTNPDKKAYITVAATDGKEYRARIPRLIRDFNLPVLRVLRNWSQWTIRKPENRTVS
jgi:hypothetical protein